MKLLVDSLDFTETSSAPPIASQPKTGVEIATMLAQIAPMEFVDPELTDPVEWVNT